MKTESALTDTEINENVLQGRRTPDYPVIVPEFRSGGISTFCYSLRLVRAHFRSQCGNPIAENMGAQSVMRWKLCQQLAAKARHAGKANYREERTQRHYQSYCLSHKSHSRPTEDFFSRQHGMIIALGYIVSAFDQAAVVGDFGRVLQTRAGPRVEYFSIAWTSLEPIIGVGVARPVRTHIFKMESGCSAPVPGQF